MSTYSSPSRRAVESIAPNASDPDEGSVIAQAPIASSVSKGSAQRSFCARVPRERMARAVSMATSVVPLSSRVSKRVPPVGSSTNRVRSGDRCPPGCTQRQPFSKVASWIATQNPTTVMGSV